MNKELAKTLTTALVQFIDKERPEGTMCCSNAECERLEKAFEANNLDFVEGFMEKKLSRLTEFEQEVSDMVEYCKENGEHVALDYAKRRAKTLLAIAREQFKPEIDAEIEKAYKTQDVVVFRKGWEQGKEEVFKDLEKTGKVHCKSYDKGFQDGKAEAMADLEKTFECNLDNLPKWLKDKIDGFKFKALTKGYNKGYKDAEKQYNESVAYHFPIMPQRPLCYEPGGTCTNPHMDCINCPKKTTGGGFNTSSGTSTVTLHGNTSATDGKERNPSFTD